MNDNKYNINKVFFIRIIMHLNSIINDKSVNITLTYFQFCFQKNCIEIRAQNTDARLVYKINTENSIEKNILIKASNLFSIIKKLVGSSITLEYTNDYLILHDKKGSFKLRILSGNYDFSISENFQYIKCEKNHVILLQYDNRRIAIYKELNDYMHSVTLSINLSLCNNIAKYINGNVKIFVANNTYKIESDEMILYSVMTPINQMLNYEYLLNKSSYMFSCDGAEFKAAINRVLTLSSKFTHRIILEFMQNNLKITSFDPVEGEAITNIEGNGNFDGNININGIILKDSLNALNDSIINIYYQSAIKPIVLESFSTHVIVPIRI